jgi:3-oxoacyl-[acyl-carrier protein] reductase
MLIGTSSQRIMVINVRAPSLLVSSIAPVMNQGGRIINVSSIIARSPTAGYDIYAASKAALEGLTRQWAVTLGKSHGITVNAITPGIVETDIISGAVSNNPALQGFLDEQAKAASAASRLGTVDDIAQIAAMLASEGSRWITGDCISGNGGVYFK